MFMDILIENNSGLAIRHPLSHPFCIRVSDMKKDPVFLKLGVE